MINYVRYWIGDLLHVLGSGTHWNKVAKFLENHPEGGSTKLSDGRSVVIYPLKNPKVDIIYDQVGNTYSIDSGTIGLIKESDIKYGRNHFSYEELATVGVFHELPEELEHTGEGFIGTIELGPVHLQDTKFVYEN